MASSDIVPCRGIIKNENDKFALNSSGKTIVRVGDDDALAVLEQILTSLGGTAGTPYFEEADDVTIVAGSPLTVLSSAVPVSTTRQVSRVIVSTRASGTFEVTIGGVKVGSGRTGPSQMNVAFDFNPVRSASATDVIEVSFTMLNGRVGQTVEVFLMATDTV